MKKILQKYDQKFSYGIIKKIYHLYIRLLDFIGIIKNNFYFRNKKQYIYFTESVTEKKFFFLNLCNKYGSDKGGDPINNLSNRKIINNYASFYEDLFFENRSLFKNIFELGLGTNNLNIPSNMGPHGRPGASLKVWKDFFFNANIYGADIDKNILFQENRISTYYCDQLSTASIKGLFKSLNINNFDLIIDDALHIFKANIIFFEIAINYLDKKGFYIIEDVSKREFYLFREYFANKKNYDVKIIDIYNKFTQNSLVLIRKIF